MAGVLLQKNHEGNEQPISFYKKTLRDTPLKHNILDKKYYYMVQSLKEFRVYILHSLIFTHMPTSIVKEILTQPDPEGRRGKWIAVLLEYNLEIKPTKLNKGQGIAKIMSRSNCDGLILHMIAELSAEEKNPQRKPGPPVGENFLSSSWYTNVILVLQHLQASRGMDKIRAKFLK